MKFDVKVLERCDHYEGFFKLSSFRLRHTLYSGAWSETMTRELFHRGSCVAVLPYDPARGEVLLLEQFRIGALGHQDPPWLIEIVAGSRDLLESPEEVANREAEEEAGLRFERLHRLGEFFTSPGGTSERVTLFVGEVQGPLQPGFFGLSQEHEDIRTRVVSLEKAAMMVEEGEINSLIPAYAIQWLMFRGLRYLEEK